MLEREYLHCTEWLTTVTLRNHLFTIFVNLIIEHYCKVLEWQCDYPVFQWYNMKNHQKAAFLSFFWHRPHKNPHSISDISSSKCYHSNCFWKLETNIIEHWPDTTASISLNLLPLHTCNNFSKSFSKLVWQTSFPLNNSFFLYLGFDDHLV